MNHKRWLTLSIAALLNLMPGMITVHAADTVPIAGLSPWQRPTGAPRITTAPPPDPTRALHGISTPIPASLKFLDDQGSWYTPFTEPGMPPPYDLRGWHSKPPVSGQSKK
jgi:hypothetical protein